MSTPFDIVALRRNETTTQSNDPLSKQYWTEKRLRWLKEVVDENNDLYGKYLVAFDYSYYRGSTSELVRRLKGLPEWAGLSARQAHRAVVIGLARIYDDDGDPDVYGADEYGDTDGHGNPWNLLRFNELQALEAEEDFVAGWEELRIGTNPDALPDAVAHARHSPIKWSSHLEEKLSPVTPKFRLFCDVCICLQTMVGKAGYILLPQHQLAELLRLKQPGISSFCKRAERAGLLQKVDASYSYSQHKAIRWRCTLTAYRPEGKSY